MSSFLVQSKPQLVYPIPSLIFFCQIWQIVIVRKNWQRTWLDFWQISWETITIPRSARSIQWSLNDEGYMAVLMVLEACLSIGIRDLILINNFFKKSFLADTYPFGGPLVPLFWISGDISSGFQSQSGFCLIHFFVEVNVMYTLQDSPLVLHVPTSWWPAAQPVTSPHASAEMALKPNG